MPGSDKELYVEAVLLRSHNHVDTLIEALRANSELVFGPRGPKTPEKDTTKEKNGAGNNKK